MKALFVVDNAGEETGTSYIFCGEKCRERFAYGDENHRYGETDDADISDGDECDYCGQPLTK